MAKAPPQQKPLDKFLDDLPIETAEEIRETAAVMMRNEQASLRLRGVELELRPFFIAATISFLIGMTILLFYSQPGEFLDSVAGAWPLLTAALGFLPGLLAYYAIRIRKRSQADIHNFDLNREIFLPHGAIYFPSDSASAEQMVTLVEVQQAPIGRPSRWDKVKPGAIW